MLRKRWKRKHYTENKLLGLLNLGNAVRATPETSQHCFLAAQTRKHFQWKQNVFEKKNRNIFCFWEANYVFEQMLP